jgi:hypothetical protein
VERFLREGLASLQEELGTTVWFALRLGRSTFGIFDAFQGESGEREQLCARVEAALRARAAELLSESPIIEEAEVLAAKLP